MPPLHNGNPFASRSFNVRRLDGMVTLMAITSGFIWYHVTLICVPDLGLKFCSIRYRMGPR